MKTLDYVEEDGGPSRYENTELCGGNDGGSALLTGK
jgi:hypothetical protein